MEKINRFEDLEVWQKATELAVKIYKIGESDRLKYNLGLKDQIQRAAVSISSNIAEGFEFNNNKNFVRFLYYSKASCGELRSHVYILMQLAIIDKTTYDEIYSELILISKKISAFIKYLKKFEEDKTKVK